MPKTEVKPGVVIDAADYGRTPDQGVTDMSHEQRNLAKTRESNAGRGQFAPKKGRAPRNRLFNTDGSDAA